MIKSPNATLRFAFIQSWEGNPKGCVCINRKGNQRRISGGGGLKRTGIFEYNKYIHAKFNLTHDFF